jgi:hypothetical protein
LAVKAHDEPQIRGSVSDHREVEPPFAEDRLGRGVFVGLEHHEHALLALRQHHLIRRHAGLAAGHLVKIEGHAEVALGAHLDRRGGQARRAHVLDGDDAALLHDLQAGFEQQLFGEGVADLHGRALALGIFVESCGRHRRAMDPVAAGLGAEIDDRHANAGRRGVENLVGLGEADGHCVDQIVAVVAGVEPDLAADRRHPERV